MNDKITYEEIGREYVAQLRCIVATHEAWDRHMKKCPPSSCRCLTAPELPEVRESWLIGMGAFGEVESDYYDCIEILAVVQDDDEGIAT